MNEYLLHSGITMLAFCLMPNHFHFLLRQDIPESMSKYVGKVCKSYAQAINVQQKRSGHLFEGKYRCKHIDDISYLLHLSRYIHLNPVDAKLVQKPEQWEYSSYRDYCNTTITPSNENESFTQSERLIVDTETILQEFKTRSNYISFVEDYASPKRILPQYLFDE